MHKLPISLELESGLPIMVKLSSPTWCKFSPPGSNLYTLQIDTEENEQIGWLRSDCENLIKVFTSDDNIAAERVTARKVTRDMSPLSTQRQILTWLDDCTRHQCCPEQTDRVLPTRLIDVRTLQLVATNGGSGKYVALSYCWGRVSQVLLQKATLQSFANQIDSDGLPQTIKDAILVTRSLSIHYLWVRVALQLGRSSSDHSFKRWILFA